MKNNLNPNNRLIRQSLPRPHSMEKSQQNGYFQQDGSRVVEEFFENFEKNYQILFPVPFQEHLDHIPTQQIKLSLYSKFQEQFLKNQNSVNSNILQSASSQVQQEGVIKSSRQSPIINQIKQQNQSNQNSQETKISPVIPQKNFFLKQSKIFPRNSENSRVIQTEIYPQTSFQQQQQTKQEIKFQFEKNFQQKQLIIQKTQENQVTTSQFNTESDSNLAQNQNQVQTNTQNSIIGVFQNKLAGAATHQSFQQQFQQNPSNQPQQSVNPLSLNLNQNYYSGEQTQRYLENIQNRKNRSKSQLGNMLSTLNNNSIYLNTYNNLNNQGNNNNHTYNNNNTNNQASHNVSIEDNQKTLKSNQNSNNAFNLNYHNQSKNLEQHPTPKCFDPRVKKRERVKSTYETNQTFNYVPENKNNNAYNYNYFQENKENISPRQIQQISNKMYAPTNQNNMKFLFKQNGQQRKIFNDFSRNQHNHSTNHYNNYSQNPVYTDINTSQYNYNYYQY